ncbi:MAG: hypothetical protein ACREEM_26620 [Blastocatellia bacterium]
MSKITIEFEDLCAFFPAKLPHQLMVGLINNQKHDPTVLPDDAHEPFIIIREIGGDIVKQYRGFEEVSGDISLEVDQGNLPHGITQLNTEDAANKRYPFDRLIDIEGTLYPDTELHVDVGRCEARLHFQDGELYTRGDLYNVCFAELDRGHAGASAKLFRTAVLCGLDVTIPNGGHAVLNFQNGTADFLFREGVDYKVKIHNLAQNQDGNHFQYYYGLLRRPAPFKLVPHTFAPISGRTSGSEVGDPLCMHGGFGNQP